MGKQKTEARVGQGAPSQGHGKRDGGSNVIEQGGTPVGGQKHEPLPQAAVFKHTVQIDGRSIEVNYGTKEEFVKLLNECSLQAATDIQRPNDSKRKFFKCIHCGDTTFTNKMRLNKHRWDAQCPAVKDAMGNPMKLLPYPDQGRGQGKVSEMIRKGKDVDVDAKFIRTSKDVAVDVKVSRISDASKAVPFESKVLRSSKAAKDGPVHAKDIATSKPSKPKQKALRKREESPPPAGDLTNAEAPSDENSDDSSGDFVVQGRTKIKTSSADGGSRLQQSCPVFPPSTEHCPGGPPAIDDLTGHVHGQLDVKAAHSPTTDPVWGQRGVLQAEATKLAGKKRPSQVPEDKRVEAAKVPPHKRVKGGHDKAFKVPKPVECRSLTIPPFDCGEKAMPTSSAAATTIESDCNETLPEKALGDETLEQQHSLLPSGVAAEDFSLVSPDHNTHPHVQSTNHPTLAMVFWTGNYEGNAALQRYWMCGVGSPQPVTYHPELAASTAKRAKCLERDEREVEMTAKVEAEELARKRPRLSPPTRCKPPDLYQLLRLRPQLLDWSYEGQSGQDFKDNFQRYLATDEFRAATRDCVLWWSCDAKEEDYPGVCKAVGRAVSSLAKAVKYSQVPTDIPLLADYLQYVKDFAAYEERCRTSVAELQLEQERLVEHAVAEFRQKTIFRRESNLWDWCPIWWVVCHDSILPTLPPLPWRHDDAEAATVRDILLAKRVPRLKPPHFVKVLRLAMNQVFGRWRQLSCPIFGVSENLVRTMCNNHKDVMLALSTFTFEAPFRFAGMGTFEAEVVHTEVMKDAELVCKGKDRQVLDSIMQWAHIVRVRALQDLALHFPQAFRRCWTTTTHEQWREPSRYWTKGLRIREDFDMGWVADESAPLWAQRVRKSRQAVMDLVQSMETAFEEDDHDVWNEYHSLSSKTGDTKQDEVGELKATEHTPVHDDSASVHDGGSVSQGLTISQLQRSVHVDDIQTQDLNILHLQIADTPPNLLGLICKPGSDCNNAVAVVEATPRSLEEQFAAVHGMAGGIGGGGIGSDSAVGVLRIDDSAPNSGVNDDSDEDSLPVTEGTSNDTETLQRLRHRKSVTFVPLVTRERESKPNCKLSIRVTYDSLKIEDLIDALPRKGNGDVDGVVINFYGGEWDSLPVPTCQLQNLKKTRKFLGQNIVELLSRRLWWSLSREARGQVYVASSFMQGPLQGACVEQKDDALRKWGRTYLVPCRIYSTCPPKLQVLVPYVARKHWSLFIFTDSAVFHLDSVGSHNEREDDEYVTRVRTVWESLHEPGLSLPPVKEVLRTTIQQGNYECGFWVLRFIEIFLRIFHGDDPILDSCKAWDMFRQQVTLPATGGDMQKNVIAAMADELGETSISELYEPPYRVTFLTPSADDSSPQVLMKSNIDVGCK